MQRNPNPNPNPNSAPAPPGSPEMELLGWQPRSSFISNFLAAANEQPPPGRDLPVPATAYNYFALVGMRGRLPRLPLVIPASQLLRVPVFEPPAYPLPLPRGRDYPLEAVPEEEELGGADDEDEGNEPLLDEQVPPPLFTLSDAMAETCILQKKVKIMYLAGSQYESEMKLMMPKVTATGNGDFGKKIEGFMFQYGKKGDVALMCFCHGNVITPAEFIKHAGGTPVSDPLAQIKVYIPTV